MPSTSWGRCCSRYVITAQRLGKQLPMVLELWHNLVGTTIVPFAQVWVHQVKLLECVILRVPLPATAIPTPSLESSIAHLWLHAFITHAGGSTDQCFWIFLWSCNIYQINKSILFISGLILIPAAKFFRNQTLYVGSVIVHQLIAVLTDEIVVWEFTLQ